MVETIDMQLMRYINLFSKISGVSTTKCFVYNRQIIFAVPRSKVSRAIGPGAENIRKIRSVLGRKIRVIVMPEGESREEIGKFVEAVINPIEFNKIEIKENSITINAGRQSKASLIGRNRAREKELSDIMKNFFHISKLRIA
ncbi:MAG: KH domain-containing protein [archaeon]|nr:KH domain-containing protein [archaeon]MCR4323766.1 KH domain-containing protein [Nanoarchaeota archaeon]